MNDRGRHMLEASVVGAFWASNWGVNAGAVAKSIDSTLEARTLKP